MDYLLIAVATFAGVSGHILKKVITEREKNAVFSLRDYLTMYPYKTAMTVFYAVGGVVGLYYADSASVYTALVTGFAANSLSGASDQ